MFTGLARRTLVPWQERNHRTECIHSLPYNICSQVEEAMVDPKNKQIQPLPTRLLADILLKVNSVVASTTFRSSMIL